MTSSIIRSLGIVLALAISTIFAQANFTFGGEAVSAHQAKLYVDDKPGVSLVAFHYNVNRPLAGVAAGDYNVDVNSKTGTKWEHTIIPSLNDGDIVYFWVLAIINGGGYQYTEQSYTFHYTTNTNYTITANAGANGSISPSGAVSVAQGANQSFSIIPNTGYQIDQITLDGAVQNITNPYIVSNVQANHTLNVTFKANPVFTITTTAGPNGSVSPSGAVQVAQGASVLFTLSPNAGYQVDKVAVDGYEYPYSNTTFSFGTVNGNHTFSVYFKAIATPTFTITASASAGGTITPNGATTVNQGAAQSFSIQANTGYAISQVLVDGSNVGSLASYTFSNVQANHTIQAQFTPIIINTTANNQKLTLSGELYNSSGTPIGNSAPVSLDMKVELFNAMQNGQLLYTESFSGPQAITVDQALFTVRLGEGSTTDNLLDVFANNSSVYAQITVGSDVMQDRIALTAAPYAMNSNIQMMTGNGNPNTNLTQAPLGRMYYDSAAQTLWVKVSNQWIQVSH